MQKWLKILIGLLAIVIVIIIAAFLIYMNTAFISKEEAKTNLAKHINIDEEDIYFENVDLEMENNQYEVDFYYNNQEYEAKIDAKEGKIIYTNFTTNNGTGSNNQNGNGNNNQNGNAAQQEITLEEAKQIALKHANLNENDVTLVKAEVDHDGEGMYEIEWRDATYEYDFDISRTGNVLHYDKDRIND